MKLYLFIFATVLILQCGGSKNRRPINTTPIPSPSPVAIPSPSPSPTPFPKPIPVATPAIDLSKFNFKRASKYTKVSAVNGLLSEPITKAMQDPNVEGIEIIGGGSITFPPILAKPTKFDSSTYYCDATQEHNIRIDIPITDYGCFLVADEVFVEGTYRIPEVVEDYFKFGDGTNPNDPYLLAVQKLSAEELYVNGTTIIEPNFFRTLAPNIFAPSIEVFQALGDVCCSHTEKSKNISIIGFRIKGRQQKYDGGIRSAILFGNVENGFASDILLEDTGSIGVTFGGSALQKNNFAKNVVATRIIGSGVGAANVASINVENGFYFNIYCRRLGHHDPVFGGGVSCIDHETNSKADHTKNINIYNNLADYQDSHQQGAGNAYLVQDPFLGENHGVVSVINNIAIGGRNEPIGSYMSNGLFLNGIKDCHIANNYIYKTGQNAIQAYAIQRCIIEDNIFDSTGGGGNPTFRSQGMIDSIIRRNHYRVSQQPSMFNMEGGFLDLCGSNNNFENNLSSEGVNAPATKRCP